MADFGVVFDADGVLFDSERQSLEALRLAVEEATQGRIAFGPDLLDLLCGRDDDSITAYLNRNNGFALDPEYFRRLKLDFYRHVIASDPIAAAPGAIALLDSLVAESVPYAIATAAIRAKLDLSLTTLGLAHRFPIITSVDDVGVGKPDPAIFTITARRLGLDPRRVVVFEDSINGIRAAIGAGMISVGVAGTFKPQQLALARHVVDSLQQVTVPLLRQWVDGEFR